MPTQKVFDWVGHVSISARDALTVSNGQGMTSNLRVGFARLHN